MGLDYSDKQYIKAVVKLVQLQVEEMPDYSKLTEELKALVIIFGTMCYLYRLGR